MAVLQCAVFLQHGKFGSPAEFPVPIVVGIVIGLVIAFVEHNVRASHNRLHMELAEKEKLYDTLKLSEERFLLATTRSFVWDWDIDKDTLYLSPGFAESLGYSDAELKLAMNGTTANLVHPDDIERYRQKLQAHLSNPSVGYINEHRFRTKSGQYKWFLAIGQSVVDETGRAIRFNGTTSDVSDRIDLEAKLNQIQKMEAIGTLTGGIAHDFNNLLAIIMGNLELLNDEIKDPDHKQLIKNGMDATQRGAELTRNMLSFARKSRLEPSVIDLNQLILNLKSWTERTLPATIKIETSLLAGLWPVDVDRSSTESGLLNLILNARDAMPKGGNLTIETSNVRVDEDYIEQRGEEIAPGRYVLLAVSDTGQGIAAENLENIFEPFFTTKPVGSGSGLGLSMLVGFMRQSGGTVRVYSELDVGTTFKLYFPACEHTEIVKTPSASISPKRKSDDRSTILLVDDNIQALTAYRSMLMKAGFDVVDAISGDDAYAKFMENPSVDLLLTDIVMPGDLQGTTLSNALRKIKPDLRVIYISGYAAEATVHGNGLRAKDIRLMKPFGQTDLLRAINKALSSD
ncbi:PAS domain-containing hybrid sensor histidine kinase/response regulator [Paramylibacter kogurei]|nr:PAS domain-containing hybrid sensor histidine kinase/response regulator [Amylibacter kogurei]